MEPPSPYTVSIRNEAPVPIGARHIRRAIRAALASHEVAPGRVAVWVTTDAEIQRLNKEYRGIDEPTDVLTFPAPWLPSAGRRMIGDIAISVDMATRQAERRGAPLTDELAYLAMHGALHLAGMDDETDEDRRAMQREMARLGEVLGLYPEPEWTSLLHGEPAMATTW